MEQARMQRLSKEFDERVKSFLQDGYCQRVKVCTSTLLFARLHHMSNGNDVIISGDLERLTLLQKTNGIIKYMTAY